MSSLNSEPTTHSAPQLPLSQPADKQQRLLQHGNRLKYSKEKKCLNNKDSWTLLQIAGDNQKCSKIKGTDRNAVVRLLL